MSWLSLPFALVAAHVLANVVWIGALLAVAAFGAGAAGSAAPAEVGALARRVYTRLAVPAFAASFMAGLGRILLEPRAYAHMPWMHAKLTLAVAVIALHHIIGARVGRVAAGSTDAGRGLGIFAFATFVCAAGAVLLGVAKSLP
ncbi:MAG TPA: CopD family protein [Polyangiaceae bacterium]|nr:CopD family protein [Polyangiaceae bacterium]